MKLQNGSGWNKHTTVARLNRISLNIEPAGAHLTGELVDDERPLGYRLHVVKDGETLRTWLIDEVANDETESVLEWLAPEAHAARKAKAAKELADHFAHIYAEAVSRCAEFIATGRASEECRRLAVKILNSGNREKRRVARRKLETLLGHFNWQDTEIICEGILK